MLVRSGPGVEGRDVEAEFVVVLLELRGWRCEEGGDEDEVKDGRERKDDGEVEREGGGML